MFPGGHEEKKLHQIFGRQLVSKWKLKTNEYIVTKIRRKTFNQFRHRHLHKPSEDSFE